MKTPTYTLYYKEDARLTYLPKDSEMTALKYVAVRYIEQGAIPKLMINPVGGCFDETLTERHMEALKDWFYGAYPQYRRESRRIHLLEKMNLSINQQHA